MLNWLLIMILLFPACTMWNERPAKAWNDVTGGESLERVLWRNIKDKNWKELEPHLAPNFVLVTPSGSYDRLAAMEHWKQLNLEEYSLGNFDVQLNGDTYVVSYMVNLRANRSGRELTPDPLRVMTVWQHQGSQWLMLAHAASPAAH
jgi:hypothetical protein